MQRRMVLGGGLAGLAFGIVWPVWARGTDAVGVAAHHVALARAGAGLTALTLRPALTGMAQRQVLHMADRGAATHLDASGRDPQARAGLAGYSGQVLGEALAETFDGPVETVALWLDHAQTRAVLLDPAACDLGLAMRRGDDRRIWWTLVVAA
jgi:uncharacterized protein YkwD